MPGSAYHSIAPYYDMFTTAALRRPHHAIARLCRQANFNSLLDMGCGTGELVYTCQSYGIRATGLDSSPAMLEYALKKQPTPCGQAPHNLQSEESSAHFVLGDALHPPFSPKSFDAVCFSLVLHETDTNPLLLLEKAFELAPYVLVLEWHAPGRNLDYLCTFWAHGIERLAGKKHYANYRNFIRKGGIFHLAYHADCTITHTERLLAGSMIFAVLQKTTLDSVVTPLR